MLCINYKKIFFNYRTTMYVIFLSFFQIKIKSILFLDKTIVKISMRLKYCMDVRFLDKTNSDVLYSVSILRFTQNLK